AGALLSTVFPAGALVGTAGGLLARMAGGIGSLLHLGVPLSALAGRDIVPFLQELEQRVRILEGQGQPPSGSQTGARTPAEPTQPPSQPATIGFSLHGE